MIIRQEMLRTCSRVFAARPAFLLRRSFAPGSIGKNQNGSVSGNEADQLQSLEMMLDSMISNVPSESEPEPEPQEEASTSAVPSELPTTREMTPSDRVIEDYYAFRLQKELTGSLGSVTQQLYQPHSLLTNPPSPSDITLELLLASQSHLGHSTSLWNPANARYIFGVRQGIHIISLDVTAAYLRRAAKIVSAVTERAGLVLFVGTRKGQDRCVVKAAELAGGCHLFERWIPGSITNRQQLLNRSSLLKVVNELDEELPQFEDQLQRRGVLKPDLVVCLNPMENHSLLHECGLSNIPTIGIIDTDANPAWVTYPIPANDDSLRCVQVIAGVLGRAGEEGQKLRRLAAKEGRVTYAPAEGLRRPKEDKRQERG